MYMHYINSDKAKICNHCDTFIEKTWNPFIKNIFSQIYKKIFIHVLHFKTLL